MALGNRGMTGDRDNEFKLRSFYSAILLGSSLLLDCLPALWCLSPGERRDTVT